MNPSSLFKDLWRALDTELDACINRFTDDFDSNYGEMIRYQLGWNGKEFDKALSGKRIRPLILLLTTHALGGDWQKALPAAAAVELVHNFSLVHDDIQDKSEKRRGRDTVWVKWGEAQAINTGDAMLALANLEILSLESSYALEAAALLSHATFNLTKGQYLDLAYEKAEEITIRDYFEMVSGKTGALFSVCFALGALLGGKINSEIQPYAALGEQLGLAFQIQDDYLGIWGQDELTGKSIESDLGSKKKTYPIIYALENQPEVREYWTRHVVFTPEDIYWIKQHLESYGADKQTLAAVNQYYSESKANYSVLFTDEEKLKELLWLINSLFLRNR